MPYPNDFQKRTIWSAGTGLAIVILGAILIGFIWLGGQILGYLQPVLVPLAVAGITAYLLDPVVAWLQKHRKLSRLKAVLSVFAGVTLLVSILGILIVPKVVGQTGDLIRDRDQLGSSFIDKLEGLQDSIPGARPLVDWLTEYTDKDGEQVIKPYPFRDYYAEKKALKSLLTQQAENLPEGNLLDASDTQPKLYIDAKGEAIKAEDITPLQKEAIANYHNKISPKNEAGFPLEEEKLTFSDQKIGILLADNWQTLTKTALSWLQATTKVFGLLGYLLGFLLVPVVLVSLIDGILVGIALSIFQLPYGFLIGLALAVIGILPFIGNIICMVPAAFIAFIHFSSQEANHQWLGDNPWAYVGAVIAIFLVVQQINSLVTAPKIVGDSVGLHPMTVIFSILFWSLILGCGQGHLQPLHLATTYLAKTQ